MAYDLVADTAAETARGRFESPAEQFLVESLRCVRRMRQEIVPDDLAVAALAGRRIRYGGQVGGGRGAAHEDQGAEAGEREAEVGRHVESRYG